jgi:hypothetical protein
MKKFHLAKHYSLINLAQGYCDSPLKIIDSDDFKNVLTHFYRYVNRTDKELIKRIKPLKVKDILDIYKLLIVRRFADLRNHMANYDVIRAKRNDIYQFTEDFYDYWRAIARYGWIYKRSQLDDDQVLLTTSADSFNAAVLMLYRNIGQKLAEKEYGVFRQLPAGVNANISISNNKWPLPKAYQRLKDINFIQRVLIRPPFSLTSKSNTRSGFFQEVFKNPIEKVSFREHHFLCYPIMVGPHLTYVYFHRDFIHHGVSLCSLFEPAKYEQYNGKKPDLIYIYGIDESEFDCTYYHDKKENLYVGYVSKLDKNDYFGYMKKMLLTLHNVAMIDKNNLPMHGSMVSIRLHNGRRRNIVIVGDSGTGKSEILEALRIIGHDFVSDIKVVFDDMGTFMKKNDSVVAQGTETGAFIRIDDLETGYAYREMDRAIFLNLNKVNARLILPVTDYDFIMKEHSIDMMLYANNYDETKQGVYLFPTVEESLLVFEQGMRKAKGTTSEKGIVTSYFANPFGPLQRQKKTAILIREYFNLLFENKVKVGEIYTRLAIPGYEMEGPKVAAKALLEYLTK